MLLSTFFNLHRRLNLLSLSSSTIALHRLKTTIDYSKVPKLDEKDLDERWLRGSGPGGQSVNKTANNVILKHIPTGIIVKCHQTRSLEDNRKRARNILIERLDEHFNGENSVVAQIKRAEKVKTNKANQKRRKLEELKQKWKKEREDLDT